MWFSADVYFGYKNVLMFNNTHGLISFAIILLLHIFKCQKEWKEKKEKGKITG